MNTPVQQKKITRDTGSKSPFITFRKLDRSAEIAYYYGFMPIKTPSISRDDISKAKKVTESEGHEKNFGQPGETELRIVPEEKIALLTYCEQQKMLSGAQPAMVYYEGVPQHTDYKKGVRGHYRRFNLDILGTGKSIA